MDEATKAVIEQIGSERQRQIEQEGFSTLNDDLQTKGEIAKAAACYASNATYLDSTRKSKAANPFAPGSWPWAREWWKPTTRRRDLVKAAALIIAEIERLDRAAAAAPGA